jgi:uncharacterized protein YbjQ (UPF0145 family)
VAYKARLLINEELEKALAVIPIVSLQAPVGWNYGVRGLVTAQSVTGTGWFSDFTSAFTDAFGAQSKVYNQKIKEGENICKRSLRLQALALGGNAILATDVDYAEVGGDKAMLMVCMTGTAVSLENKNILGVDATKNYDKLPTIYEHFKVLDNFTFGAGFDQ